MEIFRGDVFFVLKGGEVGSEQYGGRPAVIVSNNKGNEHSSNVTVVFITTKPKAELPTHTTVTTTREVSTALCEGVTTISKDRLGDFCCSLKESEMRAIDNCLSIALGLDFVGFAELPFTPEEPEALLVGNIDVELIRIQTERDIYKDLYMKAIGLN